MLESGRDAVWVEPPIMVAEDDEHAERRVESFQHLRTRFGGHEFATGHFLNDPITRNENEVRPGRVGRLHHPRELRKSVVRRAHMQIGEHSDAQARQTAVPVRNRQPILPCRERSRCEPESPEAKNKSYN